MADKRISQLIERVDIANNDVLPIVASGATTTNKVTISTIQDWMQSNLDVGVTSVGLTMPSAFQVSGSPITTSGNINVTATGTASQYIRGDGSLADFPQGGGGGASVSYYLNGSVSQGTIGGIAYLEMNKTPILGAGTDFTISSDGYIASFITDAGDPALLQIPAGNWNFETYLQASSGGGTPTFYIELYKVDSGGTATLIASNSGTPESISLGTNINPYFSAIAVPQTTLLVTDRLALRYYVSPSGRTITLHTENNTLCQIITTFTTGLTALNGLTAQVQNFATGTSGTNFGITSSGSIHTFNLPDASASARGVVTTGSQVFGGVKTFADGLSLPSVGGTNQASRFVNIGTIHQGSGGSNQIGFNNSNNIYFGKGLDNGGVIQWSNSAVRYYTLPNADGTIALTSDLGNYVTLGTAQTITGEKIFSSTLTVNTPSNGIGVLLNGRTSDNFSSIRFGANTGAGQYNAISANASSLDISSLGATPITFSTDTQGGGGTRMTISATGAVTLTGALNGTSATFSGSVTMSGSGGVAAFIGNTRALRTGVVSGSSVFCDFGDAIFRRGDGAVTSARIGINISPTETLDVNGTARVSGAATFSSSVTAGGVITSDSATTAALPATSGSSQSGGHRLRLTTNGASTAVVDFGTAGGSGGWIQVGIKDSLGTTLPLLLNPNGGNVGIGTNSPANILSIRQSNTSTATVLELTNTSNGSNTTKASRLLFGLADTVGTVKDAAFIQSTPSSGLPNVQDAELIFGTRNSDAAPAERMRITSGGDLLVGKTSTDDTITGVSLEPSQAEAYNFTQGSSGGWVIMCNRQASDGDLITFRQANTTEGSISVSGTTVSYNGGHLSRYSQTESNERIQGLVKGTVMSNLDQMAVWINPETGEPYQNEQLNCMKISDIEGDKNVAGVFVNWDDSDELFTNDMNIAMTGDMIIRIAEGVVVEKGDLLISAGDGTAKPQSDDLIRSNTIAKVTSSHVTCVYEDGSYCVPCVLMAC